MFRKLLATDSSSVAIPRVILGFVMFAHGAQLMLGWFGGRGFTGSMHGFTSGMHIPAVFAFLAIAAQFFGGLGLIVGLLGRVAAFGIAVTMTVAATMVHAKVGFFMNWSGSLHGEGFEYHLLAIGIALLVMIHGSGALSLDRLLSQNETVRTPSRTLSSAA